MSRMMRDDDTHAGGAVMTKFVRATGACLSWIANKMRVLPAQCRGLTRDIGRLD